MKPIGRLNVKEGHVMSIGAPKAICKRGALLKPIRASQGEGGEPSGAPQCERGAPIKPIGRLNMKEGRL